MYKFDEYVERPPETKSLRRFYSANGGYPCSECDRKETCTVSCEGWWLWFRTAWHNINKEGEALKKGVRQNAEKEILMRF